MLILSWITYLKGRALGGTAGWAGLLHPLVFGLTAWRVLRCFARGRRWFTIPNAVLGLTYLAIGLGSVYFVLRYDTLHYAALRQPDEVQAALMAALLGILAYRLGAEGPWFARFIGQIPSLPSTPRWTFGVRLGLFIALGLTIASKLALAATGTFGYVTSTSAILNTGLWSILNYLSQVGLFALCGAYYYWFSGAPLTRVDQILIVIATACLAGFALLSGMKEELLLVIFSVIIPYMWTRYSRGRRSRTQVRELAFAVGLSGAMLTLFTVNPLYRRALIELSRTENRLEQGFQATGVVAEELSSGREIATVFGRGAEQAWSRISIFPYHLAVVDQMSQVQQFKGFRRYALLPAVVVVPRVIWSDKPINTSGFDFQRDFISYQVVNSTNPTVYGWSYMESGLPGLVLILLSLGFLAGVAERYLARQRPHSLAAILLYTATFVGLADIEADPFWQLGGLPKLLLVALFAYALFSAPKVVGRDLSLLRGRFGSS